MQLRFLTPAFIGGASPNAPELRVPSIRGQLRHWHRILHSQANGQPDKPSETRCFGGQLANGDPSASSVILRLEHGALSVESHHLLPHKSIAKRRAILPDKTLFELHYNFRPGTPNETVTQFQQTLELWALLGSVGCRANRAAGSVWKPDYFPTQEEFSTALRALPCPSRLHVWLGPAFASQEEARKAASFTIHGLREGIHGDPFGFVNGSRRKSSSFKFKIGLFHNNQHRLIISYFRDHATAPSHRGKPVTDFYLDKLATSNSALKVKSWQLITP